MLSTVGDISPFDGAAEVRNANRVLPRLLERRGYTSKGPEVDRKGAVFLNN